MLKRELAQAALAEFVVANWPDRRRSDLAALPDSLRALGEVICLGEDYRAVDKGIRAVGDLQTEERAQLFTVIFPGIGEYVYQAYEHLIPSLPYQGGYARRGFRSTQLAHHQTGRYYWLQAALGLTRRYEQPLDWYAAWAPYLAYNVDQLGLVFAAAINQGDETGEKVFEVLCDSARGEHEVGSMGRHVVRSLLTANRPEGWQLMENMLVAAQRQEGLRQVILEAVDEAHPQAFARMLRVIVEQNMVRFSATVRAADVWFGLNWDVEQQRWVQASLEQLLALLEQPEQRAQALASDDPTLVYLGLWTLAFEDIQRAIAAAQPLLQDARAEHRFVAAYLLRQLGVSEVAEVIAPHLVDADSRVAVQAFHAIRGGLPVGPEATNRFEALEAFLQRFPAKETRLEPLVWPWMSESISQAEIADELLRVLYIDSAASVANNQVQRLLPYLSMMGNYAKLQVADRLVKSHPWDDERRAAVFGLVSDRSSYIREGVLAQLIREQYIPSPEEAQKFELLLTRKSADLRRGAITLLLKQDDEPVMASAQRLLNASKSPQRLAGLELLDQLQQTNRVDAHSLAEDYAEQWPKRTASEQELLDRLLASEQAVPTLEDALGLAPANRTQPVRPQPPEQPVLLVSASTQPILQALDDLLEQHRTTPVALHYHDRVEEELLGNAWWLPSPMDQHSREENLQKLPLAEVWQTWWEDRPSALRDRDGMELLRAIAAFSQGRGGFSYGSHFSHFGQTDEPGWVNDLRSQWFAATQALKSRHVNTILHWLNYLYPPQKPTETLLNAAQFTLAELHKVADTNPPTHPLDWRDAGLLGWLTQAQAHRRQHPDQWTREQIAQLWQLLRWLDEPQSESLPRWRSEPDSYSGTAYTLAADGEGIIKRMRPDLNEVLAAYRAEAATTADVYEHLLGSDGFFKRNFYELQLLTQRKPHPLLKDFPALESMVEQCRDRILTVELSRGDLPTAATAPALSLSSITGIPTVIKLLQNLGSEKFARGWLRDSQSKASVFSHLFRVSFPAVDDTPEAFAAQAKAAKLPSQQMIELAVYAPQWARYVQQALSWSDLAESVWWFHAHTKDNAWQVAPEIRELWSAQIAELTPLSSQDLIDGAVDVGWFQRIHSRLSAVQWTQLNEAAKYASGGGGHKRAQLFAEAMTGETPRAALIKRIQVKRYQDAVRALGLLPLPGKVQSKQWQADLLERYQIIQEFLRTSSKFGSQRQASEKLAARIGMENLARTAEYPDPQRLEWAMEGAAIADFAQSPVTVSVGEVAVSLSLTAAGEPEIAVTKKNKPLKNVPAKLKKNPDIKALQERKRDITRQASRMRKSLEASMCRGDEFTGTELKQLLTHPILQPILNQLVFVVTDDSAYGYPIDGELRSYDGSAVAIAPKIRLRLAHPIDFARSNWHLWQQQCFTTEKVQPFKQIFRELYVLTPAEQQGRGLGSVRYAGHQVNPRQAVALLGQRGWVAHPEEGIRRTFHDENLLVWIDFEEGWYTPTEVEGLTLDQVCFANRSDYKRLDLDAVPPRVFSEVMRDLDWVVSVAHQGGVDPEASASTVEMRAALLRETIRLLKLDNVRLQESYVLIEGTLGSYTLHLGSAIVHRQPGGSLCIVPVHAQHRGRLFLPFADDDPKTAEVMSKALMLAKDHEIQDPTILEQLL